ncbi:MAG: OFA family MFS transporter [Prevotellaceae bacterium]|jgi:OFA family oxalate/formate antiporter-like MFS transporter|nr:OFA family MFS transporter [Prevotellaceae bacterium]
MKDRWLGGAMPAVMVHISIGSVYAFSVLTNHVMENTGVHDKSIVTWAFSIAIFFLGMSAAFLGNYVEKIGPRKSALISCLFFSTGFIGSGLAMLLHSLPLFFIFYGGIMGIGLGVGYITPIKTLISWFYNSRGFATGMAVLGFGLAATIAGPLMEALISRLGLSNMFFVLGACYMAVIFTASRMISPPPPDWETGSKSVAINSSLEEFSTAQAMRKLSFYALWFMLFINISSGISLLSVASPMLQEKFPLIMTAAVAAAVVSGMSLSNAAGRFLWSSFSDFVGRPIVYSGFLLLQAGLFLGLAFTQNHVVFLILLITILTCYGAGFACIPAYLSDMYGVQNVSAIHGRVLTAWACAGIIGPFFITWVYKVSGGYTNMMIYISIAFVMAFVVSIIAAKAYVKRHGSLRMKR